MITRYFRSHERWLRYMSLTGEACNGTDSLCLAGSCSSNDTCWNSETCSGCSHCIDCSYCIGCTNCDACYDCTNCSYCSECNRSTDCFGSSDCYRCVNVDFSYAVEGRSDVSDIDGLTLSRSWNAKHGLVSANLVDCASMTDSRLNWRSLQA